MKTIQRKETDIKDNDKNINYIDLISICINQPQDKGFTIDEMRKRMRVVETIEKEKGESVIFEDQDIETIKECVNKMKWAVVHKDIVEFCNFIEKL